MIKDHYTRIIGGELHFASRLWIIDLQQPCCLQHTIRISNHPIFFRMGGKVVLNQGLKRCAAGMQSFTYNCWWLTKMNASLTKLSDMRG